MYITKKITNKNIEINFVELSLKGFGTTLYFNKQKGYTHRKIIYSDIKVENPKVHSQKEIKINDDRCRYIIIIEENGLKPKKYTVYLRNDSVIEAISIPTNHIITSYFLDFINEKILEENKHKAFIEKAYEKYSTLPKGVRNCYLLEDIEELEEAISKHTWYSNQKERLLLLPYALGSENAKRWLIKIDIYATSKLQNDIDSLAIYVAFRLTRSLSKFDRELVINSLVKYIPKGDEKYYSSYLS